MFNFLQNHPVILIIVLVLAFWGVIELVIRFVDSIDDEVDELSDSNDADYLGYFEDEDESEDFIGS